MRNKSLSGCLGGSQGLILTLSKQSREGLGRRGRLSQWETAWLGGQMLNLQPRPWDLVSPLPFAPWGTLNKSRHPFEPQFLLVKVFCKMSVSLSVFLKLRFPEGEKKMDALKPLCGREGLVLSPDSSVRKTVCSLVCSFLQGGKKGAPAWLPAVPSPQLAHSRCWAGCT